MDIFTWMEANKHWLQASAAIATIFGVGGTFVGHKITKARTKRAFKKKQLRRNVDVVGVEPKFDGDEMVLDFTVNQDPKNLDTIFGTLDQLEREIELATSSMNGSVVLRLADGASHRLMMETFEDTVTGQDPDANVDARAGRQVDEDGEFFCPTYHPDASGVWKIRVYVMNEKFFKMLGSSSLKIRASKKRRDHAVDVLRAIYADWKSDASKSGDTAAVWHTVNKTSARVSAAVAQRAA